MTIVCVRIAVNCSSSAGETTGGERISVGSSFYWSRISRCSEADSSILGSLSSSELHQSHRRCADHIHSVTKFEGGLQLQSEVHPIVFVSRAVNP